MWKKIIYSYIIACCVGILTGTLYSYFIPVTYTAEKTLIDEYGEMDVAIGTSHMREWLRRKNILDKGINDVEVYAKILNTKSFAIAMSQVKIPTYGISYLDYVKKYHQHAWWETSENTNEYERAIESIQNSIKYGVVTKYKKLIIQVSDPDPLVSAMLVDSVSTHLQKIIESKRKTITLERVRNLAKIREQAQKKYFQYLNIISEYQDTHEDITTAAEKTYYNYLKQNCDVALSTFSVINQQYLREKMHFEKMPLSYITLKNTSVPISPSNPHYILNILAFTFIAIVLTTWILLYKYVNNKGRNIEFGGIFSPWFITIGVWSAILFMFFFNSDLLYPLSEQFYYCLLIWICIFCITSFVTFNLLPRRTVNEREKLITVPFNSLMYYILFTISVSITPLYLFTILKVVSQFDTQDMIYNLRILALYGNENYGFLSYSYVMNQTLLIIALWRYPRIPLWQLLVIYVLSFMNAFAIMEKGMVFYIIITTLFVVYEKKLVRIWSIVFTLAGVLGFFFIINIFRAVNENVAEERTFIDFLVMYLLSPPVAFGMVDPDISLQMGSHTFQVFYQLLSKWGFGNFVVHEKTQEFVFVPISTNVYTIFQPFFQDFKYQGIAFFAMVYGILTACIYRLYQNGNAFGKIIYTFLIYVLSLQFYQENIFFNIVQFGQMMFFVLLVHQQFIGFNVSSKKR